ncbi:dynein regulatory complex subunit 7 [Misgurnus anguillicaudatus]|uniref:dynein regulatory complex subunit 7 n=1 Tax=Misgurnus anguillicaudatus TaxID=75329 RepID=UPI003CCF00B5
MDVLPEMEESILSGDEDDERVEDEDVEAVRELESSLSKTQLRPTGHILKPRPPLDLSKCPSSYTQNSPKEKLMLAMAENFRQQYALLYPDRKPLLLCPVNECGVQKFVSTTLRRTLLQYPILYSWDGCASFVSDYLSLELLDPAFKIPKQLSSPTSVLQTQRGTCFEFSCLLCSLLLGAGYDAYCVSGYASKEMCLLDQSRQECPRQEWHIMPTPHLQPQIQGNEENQKKKMKKYSVKPPPDLTSKFEKHQEEKRIAEAKATALKKQKEAEKLQEEQERPPPDPLLGLRVHSWVLVLPGNREVTKEFFIDPLTGKSYSTIDENFLGIESIWNHQNYWVNMQDCRFGCAEMTFDLSDLSKWEYMLCGPSSQSLSIVSDPKSLQDLEYEEEDETEEQKQFEMPPSWVAEIDISPQDMEMRYPGGIKVIQYRKAKLEKFAPSLRKDGLLTRLTTYTDLECTKPNTVKEWFKHRSDCLEEREVQIDTNLTTERFRPGRSDFLKCHRYTTSVTETERQMDFYSCAHNDNLAGRFEKPSEMTETFEDRTDFLFHRRVVYGKRVKVSQSAGALKQRPIQMVKEMFHRDHSRPAGKQVAERSFMMSEGQIHVTFHLEEDRIFRSWLNFTKPKEAGGLWTRDMVSGFQVDPFAKPYKNLELYQMLVDLMRVEENVLLKIKDSEKEVKVILSAREQEESNTELQISIYDILRNDTANLQMKEMERIAQEKPQRQKEKKRDPLVSFLVELGLSGPLTYQDALRLKNDCLAEFKEGLEYKEKLIQKRLEKETEGLQKKQLWYQTNQHTMTTKEKDDYLNYCSDAEIRIKVAKMMHRRHKENAPQKLLALKEELKKDPRLAHHNLSMD